VGTIEVRIGVVVAMISGDGSAEVAAGFAIPTTFYEKTHSVKTESSQ
jgi:hypothetical protein